MNTEEITAFVDTAARFAKNEIGPMLEHESRDGDLSSVPAILDKARKAGILATSNPDDPGFEFGVWGTMSESDSAAASVAVLVELARACAGVACCVHFVGLAARELPKGYPQASVAFFEPTFRPTLESIERPPEGVCALVDSDQTSLTGTKLFVTGAPDANSFVVFVKDKNSWASVLINGDENGVEVTEVPCGERIGLAAAKIVHLRFQNAPGTNKQHRPPIDFLVRQMLGISAVALGNAKGALDAASRYTAERYQGGKQIEGHEAVRILLGGAAARIMACDAHLRHISSARLPGIHEAFAAKLHITKDCAQAVTDALQCLGGYGYMEDYRLEKRLRDATALKLMAIRPDDLKMLCFEPEGVL